MPAKDLGTKHICIKCGTKFYDLKKSEIVCPKCGSDQRQTPAGKPAAAAEKRSRPPARPAAPLPLEELEAEHELEEEGDDADGDVEDDDEP